MITEDRWQKITWARELLELPAHATLLEIKNAYRTLSKEHHPDTRDSTNDTPLSMHELTEAYEIIMAHCENFKFPLKEDKDAPISDEDWWMSRFGQDPLWGKSTD